MTSTVRRIASQLVLLPLSFASLTADAPACLRKRNRPLKTILLSRVSAVTALCLLYSVLAYGQTSKAIVAGVVRDASGAVVANVTIKATNRETHEARTAISQRDGAYRIDALQPGSYELLVSAVGFNDSRVDKLTVNPSVVTTYDVSLVVGTASQTVTVEATNSGINTENGVVAGIVSARELQDLPIFSLNPVELALTIPGVQPVSQNSSFSNGQNIEVNGARPRSNNFLLDGQEINDVTIGGQAFQPQIPDIFQSVAVITNSASSEYGRAGGAVVNLVTKAGTNTFHGSAFERYTGSGLNALDGVTRQSKVHGPPPPDYVPPSKARYNQHQYGFTVGGPVIRNKLFAFGALQLSRLYGKETPNRLELPDAAGYAQLQAIGGPQVALLDQYLSNGDYLKSYVAFPGNGVITNINVGVQNNCPRGCTITTGYFQRQNAPEQNPDTQWMYRVDFTPRTQDNLSFRYLHDRTSLTPDFFNNGSALVGFDTEQGGPTELGAGTWTHVLSPDIVNELRASEIRLNFFFSPTGSTRANPLYALSTLNIANVAVDAQANSSLGPDQNFPQGRSEDLYQIQDTFSITRGEQTLRIGFDLGRTIESDLISLNAKGALTFNKGGSGVSALGNFLQNQLGPSGSATKTFGSTRVNPHGYRSGVFGQDDIKINTDLTLNLGLRYDYLTNPENSLKYPAIDPLNPYQPIDTVIKVQNDSNNLAPRVGFAYSPHEGSFFGRGNTVVRGGFGVFFDSPFSNFVANAAQQAPNAVATTLTSTQGNGLNNATSLVGSITPNLLPRSTVVSVVNNLVNPLTYQFNLGVERQLRGSNFVAVRYIGTLGKKLFANRQYNYFAPDGSGLRLNPSRGTINARGNFASSSYSGAQVEFTHNFSHGLLINANYVFSKNLDNASEIYATGANPVSSYTQADLAPNGYAREWGPSAYDHRHFVSVSYVWAPVGLRSTNTLVDAGLNILTRHWTISGIEQFQTGSYSTFTTAGYDTNGDGNAFNDRPVRSNRNAPLATAGIDGGLLTGGTPGVYYDVASALNGDGSFNVIDPGSVHWLIPYQPFNQDLVNEIGRNSFSNPGSTTNNIALQKSFSTAFLHFDQGAFVLRAEVQNLGNHNDVGILDTNVADIGSSNFLNRSNARLASQPSSPVTAGRTMVLWAKFTF